MCADPIDDAAELELLNIEIALANRKHPTIPFTGSCHWCDEPVSKGHYCDAECREDHEKYLRAHRQRSVA